MRTLHAEPRHVTHGRPKSVHTRAADVFVQDYQRERDALAHRLTFRLSGVSEKAAARAFEKNRSTVNRWNSAQTDTPVLRARKHLRNIVAGGAFPVAILADIAAETWGAAMEGWTVDDLEDRKRALLRDCERASLPVRMWAMDELEGVAGDAGEAMLEHLTRGIELYAICAELRLRGGR